MADESPQNQQAHQSSLLNEVKQLIMLSIGLQFEEKNILLGKLKRYDEKQLLQLQDIFTNEKERKIQLMQNFFGKHPDLYPEYERLSQGRVNKIYGDVENEEQAHEDSKMQELLKTDF